MEIRHLKLVKAIVEEGSLTRAINKLHVTQSALSHQLKEIETELKTNLFLRQNKKLIITEAGRKVYEAAEEVLKKLESAQKEINAIASGYRGTLKISSSCYTSYHWLPPVMKQFQKQQPGIDLNVVLEATGSPLKYLLAHELDLFITSDPVRNELIRSIELFQDELFMVVPKKHPWANKKYVIAEDFKTEQLIIHSLPLSSVTVYQSLLAPAGVQPQKLVVLPLTEAAVEMVKAEMGVLALANWALKPYLKGNELKAVKIGRYGLKRTHSVAILKNKSHPEYLNTFIRFLKNEIKRQGELQQYP